MMTESGEELKLVGGWTSPCAQTGSYRLGCPYQFSQTIILFRANWLAGLWGQNPGANNVGCVTSIWTYCLWFLPKFQVLSRLGIAVVVRGCCRPSPNYFEFQTIILSGGNCWYRRVSSLGTISLRNLVFSQISILKFWLGRRRTCI